MNPKYKENRTNPMPKGRGIYHAIFKFDKRPEGRGIYPASRLSNENMVEWLYSLIESKLPVIVEGKKDVKALKNLGVMTVIAYNSRPTFEIVELIVDNYPAVVVLTDLDTEGKKIYGRLRAELSPLGVQIVNKYRDFLFKETSLRQIEGIDSYMARLEMKPKLRPKMSPKRSQKTSHKISEKTTE